MGHHHHHHHVRTIAIVVDIWLILLSTATWRVRVGATIDCTTVTQLLNTCSVFITYGAPDPLPGSLCCDAVSGLNSLGYSNENRQSICWCVMTVIGAYRPNPTALATLPGLCGVSLGFTIDHNTGCTFLP